jgi:hypothetical protein
MSSQHKEAKEDRSKDYSFAISYGRNRKVKGATIMWLLIMIVLYGDNGVHMRYHFYEGEVSCNAAAKQFVLNGTRDYKLRAFCIRGDD